MYKITQLEVHTTFLGDIILQGMDGNIVVYDETKKEFTDKMYDLIAFRYPDAMKALHVLYRKSKPNFPLFRYKIVSRFLRCNLGGYDNELDFEPDGTINLESVPCPLRKECEHENVICRPQSQHPLSPREFEVMQYLHGGDSFELIAERLYISVDTCRTHKQNAMRKLKCHSMPEFMRYAKDNNLFDR
jgi:DNA-binding CsgD family transcriptional regulator